MTSNCPDAPKVEILAASIPTLTTWLIIICLQVVASVAAPSPQSTHFRGIFAQQTGPFP
jgi:hypothetical protein